MSYLAFTEAPSVSGKTLVVTVYSLKRSIVLGSIQWYGPWRQYAFVPGPGTIWNVDCMNEVQERIRALMLKRKEEITR